MKLMRLVLLCCVPLVALGQSTTRITDTYRGKSESTGLTTAPVGTYLPANLWYDTLEYTDMRSVTTAGSVCMADAEFAANPGGACTNPQGHSSIWTGFTYILPTSHMRIVNDPANCRGNWCLKENYTTDLTYGDNGMAQFGYSGPGAGVPQGQPLWRSGNGYLRFYIKFDSNFRLPNTCTGGKLVYWGGTVALEFYPLNETRGNRLQSAELKIEMMEAAYSYNLFCNKARCHLPFDGNWHYIEMHNDSKGQFVEVWLDGTLVLQHRAPQEPTMIPNVFWVGWYGVPGCSQTVPNSCGRPPAMQCKPAVNTAYYVDDIAVSTRRIGP